MAGFDYAAGRSNNMIAAEANGMVTIGRWAKRLGVSARAAVEVMSPGEAHHTGTGWPGRSRLTPVIDAATEPTPEQLAAMQAWDRGERVTVRGWCIAWRTSYDGPYNRRKNGPILAVYEGDLADAPRGLRLLDDADFELAKSLSGRRLNPFASDFRDVCAA